MNKHHHHFNNAEGGHSKHQLPAVVDINSIFFQRKSSFYHQSKVGKVENNYTHPGAQLDKTG